MFGDIILNANQFPPTTLLLFVTYLSTLLIIVVSFVPGAGENMVRFLTGLKKVVQTEHRPHKSNLELIRAFKNFFRDAQIPLVIKILLLVIALTFILGKLFSGS